MTTEELALQLSTLRKLRIVKQKTKSTSAPKSKKSNKEKRIEDLLSKLSPEQRDLIEKKLK